MSRAVRSVRSDNRLPQILDAAAHLLREKGYYGTSVRDIMLALGMPPGSLYYHFASKEDLVAAVYAEGVRRISDSVTTAAASCNSPWERLEAACIAHLEALLQDNDYAQVVIRIRPADVPGAAAQLVKLRDGYEQLFVKLVDALPLPARTHRRSLRLMLLGALNWSQTWYRAGRDTPRSVARRFVNLLRMQLDPEN